MAATEEFREVQFSKDLSPGQKQLLRRAVIGSAAGNAVEWYDYGVYALLAATMGKVFFASQSSAAQIIATYAVFAVSFLIRPLGGIVLGSIGDRVGRRQVLVVSIILMSLSTALIGVLPSSQSVGLWSPILLIILRLIQGFSTGGEYGGAATLMAEYSPVRQRGFYGSFLEFSTTCGGLFGLGLVTTLTFSLSSTSMNAWGWRIPFILALPIGLVGLYMRLRLQETPVFREAERQGIVHGSTASHAKHIGTSWRSLLVLMGLVLMLNLVIYTIGGYMPQYLEGPLGLTSRSALMLLLVMQCSSLLFIPIMGWLSDRIGRRPCWYISAGGFIVLAYPAFLVMQRGFGWAIGGLIVLSLLMSLQRGTITATFPALFATGIRYAGFALGYNVATSLFGGTAPLVNASLIGVTGNKLFPAFYVMGACVIGLVAALRMPETAGVSLRVAGTAERGPTPASLQPSAMEQSKKSGEPSVHDEAG